MKYWHCLMFTMFNQRHFFLGHFWRQDTLVSPRILGASRSTICLGSGQKRHKWSLCVWFRFLFVYQNFLKRLFKSSFWVKNTFWICVCVLWIHKGYFLVKVLLEIFALKLSGIQSSLISNLTAIVFKWSEVLSYLCPL